MHSDQRTANDAEPDLERQWRLHPRVSLRPEPFGALAYHYDNRRLNFLRSPDLVALVEALADFDRPRSAFDALGIDKRRWPSFATALTALAKSDFVEPVDGDPAPDTHGDPDRRTATHSPTSETSGDRS